MTRSISKWNRRKFLKSGALAAAMTAGWPWPHPRPASEQKTEKDGPDPARIRNYHPDMPYRRLGNSDVYLSVLSLGGIGLEKSVLQYGIEKGVNLVHMAGGYNGGNSIKILGDVLKSKREKVYIALKDSFSSIDEDLKLLNTDHVDFLMFNRHHPDTVSDPGIFETFDAYRRQGKALFPGLTIHNQILECVASGVESGKFAMIQPVLNQNAFEGLQYLLDKAREKAVGIMGMKTMQGMKDLAMETVFLKRILSNPAVVTVNKSIRDFERFNAYLKAARETLSAGDHLRLYRFTHSNRPNVCMMCGSCEAVCPDRIDVSTILRSKMYYHDQLADEATARETFRSVRPSPDALAKCPSCRRCESVCPNGLAVTDRLAEALRFFEYGAA